MSAGPHAITIGQLPDELLSRILAAAATKPTGGGTNPRIVSIMSRVCHRWRGLCFSAPELWQSLTLEAPMFERAAGERQRWLQGKLWLLQRVSTSVHHLRITDYAPEKVLMEPLMRAAPCTLRSLDLDMWWGAHLSGLPQLLQLARAQYTSLYCLKLSSCSRVDNFGGAAQQQPGVTAAQLEARLVEGVFAGLAALAGALTELSLNTQGMRVLSLAPLTALQRLRRLVVSGCSAMLRQTVPAPAQFLCLEEFSLDGLFRLEADGTTFSEARWQAAPVGTLWLRGARVTALPTLLVAMQPPAARPLERLVLEQLVAVEGASAPAAALQACAAHLESTQALQLLKIFWARDLLQPLLRQLPRLNTLRLTRCGLAALPEGTYLLGLRTLSLANNEFRTLPPPLLHATRLTHLDLQGNRLLQPQEAQLQQLLDALPKLRQLDLQGTDLDEGLAEELARYASRTGLAVQLPEYEDSDDYWQEGDYYSSDSDSSDDGCPRYSWAGCAYASRW